MRDILPQLEHWQREAEDIALATVVRVRGSAPRPVGARLAVTRSGRMAGSVSGGCVETDVFERAQRVLDDGRPAIATYTAAEPDGLRVGLACGGAIDVLIEAFEADAAWQALRVAQEQRRTVALCVALEPQTLRGRKLVVTADLPHAGGIDAALDAEVAAAARVRLAEVGASIVDLRWYGATVSVFVEVFQPPPRLFLVGATHIAVSLCSMAKELGFQVHIIDPRAVFASVERFPAADELIHAWPAEAFEKIELTADAHVVTLTHDEKFDLPALALALRSSAGSVGALGSRATHARRVTKLRELGFTDAELARIHGPVGLDLGARTPAEIALSILSEIVATQHGRGGGPLHAHGGPVHAGE